MRLKKQKDFSSRLVQNSAAPTFVLDSRHRVIIWNKSCEDLTGVKAGGVIGTTKHWRAFYEHRRECLADIIVDGNFGRLSKLYKSFQKSSILSDGLHAERWFKNLNGSQKYLIFDAGPVYDNKGRLIAAIETLQDLTELKQTAKKLETLNKQLLKSNKDLKKMILRDDQTGLYNHRYLTDIIESEFHRAKRYTHPLSIIMFDVDYFRSINLVYGHPFGDIILKQLAGQLKKLVRKYDILIRFGGEEFIIISPGINRINAQKLAERISDTISFYNFGNKQHIVRIKLSIAVVSYPEDNALKGYDLIETADEILNRLKELGGNAVVTSEDLKRKSFRIKNKKQKSDIEFLKEKLQKLTKQSKQSLIESVFAFAKTLELKDHFTGRHVEKTVYYATEIAKALDLRRDQVELIKAAAILHDLGKIGISEKILIKNSKLSKDEFDKIKKHPQIGVDIIRPIQFLHALVPLILYHHERWDGKGYPYGLKAQEIPVGARIVALADVYQALTSNRPYRKAFSKKEAAKLILKGKGTQFDPQIVDKFLRIIH